MQRNEASDRVESVHRALVLLKLIGERGSLSVTEAAKALEVNPSTAQRLLVTLVGDGFARQGERKRYEPGPELLRPGASHAIPPLRARLRPHLERLFERVGETVHVATLVGTEIHHLDGVEAIGHPLRFGLRIGVRLPAHQTSAGKAMLATLDEDDLDARYQVAMHSARGTGMKVKLEDLHQQLAKVRRQRVATNFEESEPGVAAFATSIGVIDGERAAFSIAMPIARFQKADLPKFVNSLVRTADEAADALLL